MMAHIRVRESKAKRNGKRLKRYVVEWTEPVRDHFGVALPANPDHPNGPKRMRPRQETYPTRDAAEARRDELNAARHTTGTSALADQRAAGELPFGFYARGWLQQQEVKAASGKLKAYTVAEYGRQLRTYVLPTLGASAVASISPAHVEELLAALVRQTSRQGDRKPLTPGTVKHIWDVTRRVFKFSGGPDGPTPLVPVRSLSVGEYISLPRGPGSIGRIPIIRSFNEERTRMTVFVQQPGKTVTLNVGPDEQFVRVAAAKSS
jgi:integrase